MKQIDINSTEFGVSLGGVGFVRVSARCYLRVTSGDVVQRVELRPNRHGGQITCDLTLHPLWAREHLSLDVLEPGIWIGTLCERVGARAVTCYERDQRGLQEMVESITTAGLPWFEANSTAEGIVQSAAEFPEPWRNEEFVHVELGHCYLRAGKLEKAKKIFDRKPSRVPRYKTLAAWISQGDVEQINSLHADWMASSRVSLPVRGLTRE